MDFRATFCSTKRSATKPLVTNNRQTTPIKKITASGVPFSSIKSRFRSLHARQFSNQILMHYLFFQSPLPVRPIYRLFGPRVAARGTKKVGVLICWGHFWALFFGYPARVQKSPFNIKKLKNGEWKMGIRFTRLP